VCNPIRCYRNGIKNCSLGRDTLFLPKQGACEVTVALKPYQQRPSYRAILILLEEKIPRADSVEAKVSFAVHRQLNQDTRRRIAAADACRLLLLTF